MDKVATNFENYIAVESSVSVISRTRCRKFGPQKVRCFHFQNPDCRNTENSLGTQFSRLFGNKNLFDSLSSLYSAPSNQPPMLFNTSTQSNFFTNLGTSRRSKHNLCHIRLDTQHPSPSGSGSDVNHQNLILGKFGYFGLFHVSVAFYTKKLPQQKIVYFQFGVYERKFAYSTQDMANETISSAKGWIDFSAHT